MAGKTLDGSQIDLKQYNNNNNQTFILLSGVDYVDPSMSFSLIFYYIFIYI